MYYSGSVPYSSIPGTYSGSSGTSASSGSSGFNPLSLLSSLTDNLFNFFANERNNKANKDINQANLDYNTKMTQLQWERDDNAHQREVADLEAAGLSPLANTTGNNVTSALGAPSPIAMQAPQFDTSMIINSMLQNKALDENARHNREIEGHTEHELQLKGEEIANYARSLDIQNKQVDNTIKYQADLIENEAKTIAETIEHDKKEEDLRRVEYESEQYWKEINKRVPEGCQWQDIYDFDIYVVRKNLWNTQFKNFLEKLGATQSATASSTTKSRNAGGSVSANAAGVVQGTLSGNGGFTDSESSYSMENLSEKQKQELIKFYHDHPVPIYHQHKWNRTSDNR